MKKRLNASLTEKVYMLRRTLDRNKYDYKGEHKHEEYQYLNLIWDIFNDGVVETGRNGKTKTVVGSAMHFTLEDGIWPLLTTKKVAWKTCAKELFWFIKGSTDNSVLQEQKVGIWNGNASRDYLDEIGLCEREENDLGPIYGHQWRHFNAPYGTCHDDYSGKGFDQLGYIISCLKNPHTRNSRRLVMSAWNPCQMSEMALPPCHVLAQFNVTEGNKLSCSLYQRSGDVGLGVPFNIASYTLLTHILAKHCGLIASDFYYHLGNCHIYDDHEGSLLDELLRKPFPFPTLNIKEIKENIEDYSLADLEVLNYSSHEALKMEMRK